MRAKIITAIIGLPLLLWIVWSSPGLFLLLLCIAALISWKEYQGMLDPITMPPLWLLAPSLCLAISAAFFTVVSLQWGLCSLLFLLCAWSVLYIQDPKLAFPGVAYSIAGILFVLLPLGSIAYLHQRSPDGRAWVLFLLIVVWLGDGIAFLVGSRLGRRPLAPHISPKKTVEGAIANILGAAALAALLKVILLSGVASAQVFFLGLALGGLSILGDLWESQWKRFADQKDSAQLLPGHGGILDRLDSLTLTAPFLWLYTTTFLPENC